MYNRYTDRQQFVQLDGEAPPPPSGGTCQGQSASPAAPEQRPAGSGALLGEVTGGLGRLVGGMLQNFSLSSFDTGDILLVLIILFLFLEGDNLEVVITLGLMLLLGLGGDEQAPE